MSKSSKTLKQDELPDLAIAQQKAAGMRRLEWVQWMRSTYSFAMAVKMAKYMGFSTPSIPFYQAMRSAGQKAKKPEPTAESQ